MGANLEVVKSLELDLGDEIRYTEQSRETVTGIISRILQTKGGRKVFEVTQELLHRDGRLVTTRLYDGKAEVEVLERNGGVVVGGGQPVGKLLPDVYLAIHLADMKSRAMEARDAAVEESRRPKFIVQREEHFLDVPQTLMDRLNQAEAAGELVIITDGVTSRYVMHAVDYRIEFNGDWEAGTLGPAGNDPIMAALRFKDENAIVAMTHAAKAAIDERRAEIEAQRTVDQKTHAAAEANMKLRAALSARLLAVKFIKEPITVTLAGCSSGQVDAEVFRGVAVHKSIEENDKNYVVSHAETGYYIVHNIPSKAEAKLIAARLATTEDLSLIKSKAEFNLPKMGLCRSIAFAIRDTARMGHIDPLINPALDQHLLETPAIPVDESFAAPDPQQVRSRLKRG